MIRERILIWASICLAMIFILVAQESWAVPKEEKNVLRSLQRLESYVNKWWPGYDKYSRLLREAEEQLDKYRSQPKRNESFRQAAEECFYSFKAAQEAWKIMKSSDPRKYHAEVRKRHWLNAAEHLRRAELVKD